jgi:hypothetical protein
MAIQPVFRPWIPKCWRFEKTEFLRGMSPHAQPAAQKAKVSLPGTSLNICPA